MPKWLTAGIVILVLVALLPVVAYLLREDDTVQFADSVLHGAAKKGEMGPVEELLKS